MPLLELSGFRVSDDRSGADLVRDIELCVDQGETLCIVGESGSGKTVTSLSIMRLLEFTSATSVSGTASFKAENLAAMTQQEMSTVRGRSISMIFQECMEALNPTIRIGPQLTEAAVDSGEAAAEAKAKDLLHQVGIPDPSGCMERYPHQLSGGMQQRVMIAMALMNDPELLIADEPTTALDVTIQAEILTLLARLQRDRGMAIVLITHDMGIAAQMADRIAVMYAGRLVELGSAADVLSLPEHPYTRALLDCIPRPHRARGALKTIPGSVPAPFDRLPGCRFAPRCSVATDACRSDEPVLRTVGQGASRLVGGDAIESRAHTVACWHPASGAGDERANVGSIDAEDSPDILEPPELGSSAARPDHEPIGTLEPYFVVENLTKVYAKSARKQSLNSRSGGHGVTAVDGVDLTLHRGEFFCLVGESGSGKTTLGRLISRLESPTEGRLTLAETDLASVRRRAEEREFRRNVQVVFQDPNASLNPRQTVAQAIGEPLKALLGLKPADIRRRVEELLQEVNLPIEYASRRPSQLSGGQRQRVAIARAIATSPGLVVADEPTSALDVSVQGQIVNLFRRLRDEHGLTYLFITHNLTLVLSVADRVGVMYLGSLVEVASASALLRGPAHPYTQVLLDANPGPDQPRFIDRLAGEPSSETSREAEADRTHGCKFRDRCQFRQERCNTEAPSLTRLAEGHSVACHFPIVHN